ncbi:MAG: DUF1963 domain-containing protein [Alphaproteobacteria bacterium]|nr:DUF1963 domain-containing protein [Alphaproteobacteria bacterium]
MRGKRRERRAQALATPNLEPFREAQVFYTEAYGRACSVAEYSDWSDAESPWSSRILGPGMLGPGEAWPEREGRPLTSLLQANLTEAPALPEALQGYAWLSVYLDVEGEGLMAGLAEGSFELRLHDSLEGLRPTPAPPPPISYWNATRVTWRRHIDLPHHVPKELAHLPLPIWWLQARYSPAWHARVTKLGGYATEHQGDTFATDPAVFVLQLIAERGVFDLCDSSTSHIALVEGEWMLDSQTS